MPKGQSIIELLVGIAIAAIFMAGAAIIIAPSLTINKQATIVQTKTELATELAGNIKAWAAGNWNNVLALATGTANTYYLNTATSSFTAATGTQFTNISGATSAGYFYLSDVYRDSNGNVTTMSSGNSYDPSTKLATVIVQTLSTQPSPTTTISFYITRNASDNFNQTSWVSGAGQSGPVTLVGTGFTTSSNITVNASGSFELTNSNICIE